MPNQEVLVKGIPIKYQRINKEDYISLTDISRIRNPISPVLSTRKTDR